MTGDDVDKLIDRTLADDAFAARLVADPAAVAAEIGVTLGDEEARTLSGMSVDDVRAFATEVRGANDPDRRRAAC